MINNLSQLEWAWPWAVWFLPLPLLAYFLLPRKQAARDRALRVPDLAPFNTLQATMQHSKRGWFGALLLLLTWCFIILALARPQSFDDALGVPVSGRDLMLAIDISGSMNERDLYSGSNVVTRMAVVKYVAQDFVARRQGDRIGLIMFGSKAYVQSPLTYDHQTVQHFLKEATVGLAGHSTAIGDAIGLSVKRLRDRPSESRVIVLLTDGENSEGALNPIEAAQLAADNGIRVHTIGVGAESAGGMLGRALGVRRSELDEATLQSIAATTGGQYFRARNQSELENIYREIDLLEPTEQDDNNFRPLRELFFWPLGFALFFNVLWALMRNWVGQTARV